MPYSRIQRQNLRPFGYLSVALCGLGPKCDPPFRPTCAATLFLGPSAKKKKFLLPSPLVALIHIAGEPILPPAYKEVEQG
jgi:hypothetical protein